MKTRGTVFLLVLVALAICHVHAQGAAPAAKADSPQKMRTYYFGNSLTGCSDPKWHPELGESAGRDWEVWSFLGAGWQLWQHLYALQNAGVEMKRGDNGDLTIDPDLVEQKLPWNVKQFYEQKWDAIVLQPFSIALSFKCDQMWGVDFGKETDVGDIVSAIGIIDIYLALNPQGHVFIYQNWPAMQRGKVPPKDQLPEWARKPGRRIADAEFPRRDEFDYETKWLKEKHKPTTDPEKPWFQEGGRSRDFHTNLFKALVEHYPKLYEEGRLTVIPVGDIFMALQVKAKAGEFPGIADIEDYYTDVQHIRAGLPRYTVAASFYACIFRDKPDALDYGLYNSRQRYGYDQEKDNDRSHDKGELLQITPERAKVVNDTIWQVITGHPHTKIEAAE